MRAATILLAGAMAIFAASTPSAAGEPFEHIVPMREHASGQFYVAGVLGGDVATEFLVDTGSGFVALSKETFERLRRSAAVEPLREVFGTMANGKLLKVPMYRVAELAIGNTCRLTDVEVAVLPSGARDILGLSALKRLGPFALQMSPPQLWLTDCSLPS